MANSYQQDLLATLLPQWHQLLQGWSADGSLVAAAQEALLLDGEPQALKDLVTQWSAGDFSGIPPIVLLSSSDISGAMGAYAISTGTIYLNQDWLLTATQDQVNAVLTEELGHHLDGLLNAVDTPGDEGEYFDILLTDPPRTKETLKKAPGNDFLLSSKVNRNLEVTVLELASNNQSYDWIRSLGTTKTDRVLDVEPTQENAFLALISTGWYDPQSGSTNETILQKIGYDGVTQWSLPANGCAGLAQAGNGSGTWVIFAVAEGYEIRLIDSTGEAREGFENPYQTNIGLIDFESLPSGELVLLQQSSDNAESRTDISVTLLEPSRGTAWNSTYGTSSYDFPQALCIDSQGYIYIAGYTYGPLDGRLPSTEVSGFVSKYTREGARLWTRLISGGSSIEDIRADDQGSVYLSGKANNVEFAAKYDGNGRQIWERATPSGSLMLDADSSIYIAGGSPYLEADGFVNKLTRDGDAAGAITLTSQPSDYFYRFGNWTGQRAGVNIKSLISTGDGSLVAVGEVSGDLDGIDFIGGDSDVFAIRLNGQIFQTEEAPTGIGLSATNLSENIAAGSVVASLSTIDPDAADSFTYSLVTGTGSTDNSSFSIVGNQLKLNAVPDFESKSSYSIRLRSTDAGGLFYENSYVLNVLNVNEVPTNLTVSSTSFNENIAAGSVVASLSTIDPDATDTFTYSLVAGTGSTDNASFSIDGNQLKINAVPDFETKSSYSIRLRGTDAGGLSYESVLGLSVNNLDEPVSINQDNNSANNVNVSGNGNTVNVGTTTNNIINITNVTNNAVTNIIGFASVDLSRLLQGSSPKSDTITGSAIADVMAAGKGADRLTGGDSADQFVFRTLDAFSKKGADIITDFSPDQGDQLILSRKALPGLSKPELTTVSSKKELKSAQSSTADLIYYQPKGQLYYDENGAGKGYGSGGLFAILTGSPDLTAANLGLIS